MVFMRTAPASRGMAFYWLFNPPFALDVALNGGANATASLENPFPNLPPNSSFPNFVGNMLPSPPFTGNRFLRTPRSLPILILRSRPSSNMTSICSISTGATFSPSHMLGRRARISLWGGATISHLSPVLLNPVNGLTTNSVANADERVPFVGLSPVVARLESGGNSIYNSLQATLKKDLSHGFQFLGSLHLFQIH